MFFIVSTNINVHITIIEDSTDIALTIIPASAGPEPKALPILTEMNSTAQNIINPNTKYPKYFIRKSPLPIICYT